MRGESGPRRRTVTMRPAGSARSPADPKLFARTVGEGVRRARQTLGWTQAQLASAAGFSPNYIARLERGELGPSLFVAQKLCETLGIAVTDLLQPSAAPRTSTRRRVAG